MSSLQRVETELELQTRAYAPGSSLALHLEIQSPLSPETVEALLYALETKDLIDLRINDCTFFRRYNDLILFEAEGDLCECNRCTQPLPRFWSLMNQEDILDPLLDRLGLDAIPTLVEKV